MSKMLRAVPTIYIECQVPELLFGSRRVVLKVFRVAVHSSSGPASQTVLMSPRSVGGAVLAAASVPPVPPVPPAADGPGGGPGGRRTARSWPLAAALALTASLGGVYFFTKREQPDATKKSHEPPVASAESASEAGQVASPALAAELPARVEFLLAGGGAAGFAALRALRAARPGARVLLVAAEPTPPYLRPPLSKEVWLEPAALLADPADAVYRQWSGRRRPLLLEPREFYAAEGELRAERPRAALLALGWRVVRLDPDARTAHLQAGDQTAVVQYDQCLLAPGSRVRRAPELLAAAAAGRSLPLRTLQDAKRLATALLAAAAPGTPAPRVAVLGAGLQGCELAAALAASGVQVTLLSSAPPLGALLPRHLAADAARALAAAGVTLLPAAPHGCELPPAGVRLLLPGRAPLHVDLVVECVGAEPDVDVARASGLEIDPKTGGIMVDACLRAHAGVYVAGDAASFFWRGGAGGASGARVAPAHHDHAVRSGRAAAANMAPDDPERSYDYQPMFWSDLGPDLGFEAVGVIDSSLPTVSVFADDAVNDLVAASVGVVTDLATAGAGAVSDLATAGAGAVSDLAAAGVVPAVAAAAGSEAAAARPEAAAAGPDLPSPCRYARGVVFYQDRAGGRVVGVLMWNIFNRVQLAQQVVAQGEFDDLVEVAKLFTAREREA